jgi:RNA polymerase sigma factor (sigma-70 family)
MEAAGVAVRPFLGSGRLLRALGDDRLVARIRAGDQRAFEALYDRHHRPLLAFCRHMLGNHEEAEDVLQHTFAAAYRSLCGSENEIQLKPWLFAIARNRCLSVLRARREQAELRDEVAPTTDGLHRQVEQRADLQELLADLQELPDDQRAALVLSELGAHSHDEIAMILEVRKDKVKALVFQARESLVTSRRARETPCHEVQEQLATLRGGALRRAPISRHVERCPNCLAFKAEVQRQRAAMAIILPAAPSLALKSAVLGPLIGGSGIAAGLGAGAAVAEVATSAAGAGSGIAALGNGLAAKAVATAAVVASVGGGGIAADKLRERAAPHGAPAARVVPVVDPAASATATPVPPGAPVGTRGRAGGGEAPPAPAPGIRRGRRDDVVEHRTRRGRKRVPAAPAVAAPVVLPPVAKHGDDERRQRGGRDRPGERGGHGRVRDKERKGAKHQVGASQHPRNQRKQGSVSRGGSKDVPGKKQAAVSLPTRKPETKQQRAAARVRAHLQMQWLAAVKRHMAAKQHASGGGRSRGAGRGPR